MGKRRKKSGLKGNIKSRKELKNEDLKLKI